MFSIIKEEDIVDLVKSQARFPMTIMHWNAKNRRKNQRIQIYKWIVILKYTFRSINKLHKNILNQFAVDPLGLALLKVHSCFPNCCPNKPSTKTEGVSCQTLQPMPIPKKNSQNSLDTQQNIKAEMAKQEDRQTSAKGFQWQVFYFWNFFKLKCDRTSPVGGEAPAGREQQC